MLIFGTEASGETAFLGIAAWEIRIFKRKNAKPRNAKTPPGDPLPHKMRWNIRPEKR